MRCIPSEVIRLLTKKPARPAISEPSEPAMDIAPAEASAPQQATKNAVDWIESDQRLFDQTYYSAQASLGDVSRRAAAEHYAAQGEAEGLKPSTEFDPAFYLSVYEDVKKAGLNALAHYIEYGQHERRYANRTVVLQDAERIERSGLFDDSYYVASDSQLGDLRLSDIEHYILVGGFNEASPGPDFDSGFYRAAYKDVRGSQENPLVHYLRIGKLERRYTSPVTLNHDMERIRSGFDRAYYSSQSGVTARNEDPVRHYLLEGARAGLNPSPVFSAAYYLARYPDINHPGTEPFAHYVHYGKEEARLGRPNLRESVSDGGLMHDPARPTVIVANHEASLTGAPLVGLAIARKLAATHNVITYVGRAGPLEKDFHEVSTAMVAGSISDLDLEYALRQFKTRQQLSGIVANSVESGAVLRAAQLVDIPSVLLLHEFAEYTLPPGKVGEAVAAADRVLVPANIVLESAQKEIRTYYGAPASNIRVCPQGYLNPPLPKDRASDLTVEDIIATIRPGQPSPKIVFGAGAVQIRKGVELFIQTAAEIVRNTEEDVCFLWVRGMATSRIPTSASPSGSGRVDHPHGLGEACLLLSGAEGPGPVLFRHRRLLSSLPSRSVSQRRHRRTERRPSRDLFRRRDGHQRNLESQRPRGRSRRVRRYPCRRKRDLAGAHGWEKRGRAQRRLHQTAFRFRHLSGERHGRAWQGDRRQGGTDRDSRSDFRVRRLRCGLP